MVNTELKRRLITKRKYIKKKLKQLKQGQVVQEDLFIPITKHLKNIENKITKLPSTQIKTENKKEPIDNYDYDDEDNDVSDSKKSILNNIQFDDINEQVQNEEREEEEEEEKSQNYDEYNNGNNITMVNQEGNQKFLEDYLEQFDSLPKKYIVGMIDDDQNKEYDHKYGIRFDKSNQKFMLGDSEIHLDGSDIILKNKRYKGTPGLYELLFKKHPVNNYTSEELGIYQKMVLKTNAYRRHFRADKQIDGSKLKKYVNLIAPITEGKGMMMEVNNNQIDYIYWNDVNELIDRLRLLVASQRAGNTSHNNEINSIIEELREENIIE